MSSRRSFILFHVAREPGNNIADSMSTVSSPVAPFASRDDGEVDLVDACTRKGSESYTPQPQPLVLFYCYDVHPRYDEESYKQHSSTTVFTSRHESVVWGCCCGDIERVEVVIWVKSGPIMIQLDYSWLLCPSSLSSL